MSSRCWDELDFLSPSDGSKEEPPSNMAANLRVCFNDSMKQKKKIISKKDIAKKEYYRLLNDYGDAGITEVIVSYDVWDTCRVELVVNASTINPRQIARKLTHYHNDAFPDDKKTFHVLAIKSHYNL